MVRRLIPVIAISLAAHFWLGWMWSLLGPLFGGWRTAEKGWVVGGAGLGLAWTSVVFVNYMIAPSQVTEMARVVGSLLGGLPGPFTYVITITIGILLGVAGGAVGSSLRAFSGDKD